MRELTLTPKQAEYAREANHRWNFAVGAVRSGKSHMAVQHTIPKGLLDRAGRPGINLILGATKENIERNVLAPMREIWGDRMVGDINSRNWASAFGEKVYCIGAENRGQVSKLRGSEIKFCYADEVCDVHPDVFEMLKSRLSLPYSECHAACNPEGPRHYVKRFIDQAMAGGVDMFYQHYTIYDNPFLPEAYVRSLEAEYGGTVYYKRYIQGLWAQAEGLVYPMFGDAVSAPTEYVSEVLRGQRRPSRADQALSVDYGTMNAFAALRWVREGGSWWLAAEWRYSGRDEGRQMTDADYVDAMVAFSEGMGDEVDVYVDPSAASFIAALRRCGRRRFRVIPADNSVADGIRDCAVCLQTGLVRVSEACDETRREADGYVWADTPSGEDRPCKVEDHCMDAMRYFVRTRGVYRPQVPYSSPLDGRTYR